MAYLMLLGEIKYCTDTLISNKRNNPLTDYCNNYKHDQNVGGIKSSDQIKDTRMEWRNTEKKCIKCGRFR